MTYQPRVFPLGPGITGNATFGHSKGTPTLELPPTDQQMYRYLLRRDRVDAPEPVRTLGALLLNPSKADALLNDPTVRIMWNLAERERCGRLLVGNLYAYRATDPSDLKKADDPVRPDNDYYLEYLILHSKDSPLLPYLPLA